MGRWTDIKSVRLDQFSKSSSFVIELDIIVVFMQAESDTKIRHTDADLHCRCHKDGQALQQQPGVPGGEKRAPHLTLS